MVTGSMEDDSGLTRKRGIFTDMSQEPIAKMARVCNSEYIAAFQAFDADRSGSIDLAELSGALQAVQQSVQLGVGKAPIFPRPFHPATCCWLSARFGDGARLNGDQFCELMGYLSTLKNVFEQVDTDRSGTIDCGELHRAFQLSGASFEQDTVRLIGTAYDADGNGTLEFDEFVQLRMEWDCYIAAWEVVAGSATTIQPEQLAAILEGVKRSLEPVGSLLISQADVPALTAQCLMFNSMFKAPRKFQPQTCEWLIIRFGGGNLFLNFSQFCTMLAFLKELKAAFCKLDLDRNGALNFTELNGAFAGVGLHLPPELVVQIGRGFDRDNSGEIDFDEFVQMVVEWNDMCREQVRFSARESGRLRPRELQEVFGHVRVVYRIVDGALVGLRPFHLNTCRWLVAKFGTPAVGEFFAEGVTWTEFLHLTQYVKAAYVTFASIGTSGGGPLLTQELGAALAACGLSLSEEAVQNIRRAFDVGNSGSFEFDEFLQILLECQLYEACFDARAARPGILTPLNALSPVLGQPLGGALAGGVIALDKPAFFAMVFAVPRNLNS